LLLTFGISVPNLKARNWEAVYVLPSGQAYSAGEAIFTNVHCQTVGLPLALAVALKGLSM
jgi:hypothetical protein